MIDRVLESFLERQEAEGAALARSSDVLELIPIGPSPVRRYLAGFNCRGLVWRDGQAAVVERHEIGIHFTRNYLRSVVVGEVLTLLAPIQSWHPNIHFPFICVGNVTAGMPLVELLSQIHEILTWQKVNLKESDSMTPDACAWARAHPDRFPVDTRPLRRRALAMSFADLAANDSGTQAGATPGVSS